MIIDQQGRTEPPEQAGELETLQGFLRFHRETLAWKCSGLADGQLHTAGVPTSATTLAGLVKHLAFVEDYWFAFMLQGAEPASPWDSANWNVDPDWDWHSAADDTAEQLWTLWRDAVQRSDVAVTTCSTDGGLDRVAARGGMTLRWILVHMIEEYARHNGHADFLREAIDGVTGE